MHGWVFVLKLLYCKHKVGSDEKEYADVERNRIPDLLQFPLELPKSMHALEGQLPTSSQGLELSKNSFKIGFVFISH